VRPGLQVPKGPDDAPSGASGDKPYSCHACSKAFATSSNLTLHLWVHSGDKPYSCHACSKVWVHSGDKPYSCHACGKAFAQSSHLTLHLRMRSGDKPYSCDTQDAPSGAPGSVVSTNKGTTFMCASHRQAMAAARQACTLCCPTGTVVPLDSSESSAFPQRPSTALSANTLERSRCAPDHPPPSLGRKLGAGSGYDPPQRPSAPLSAPQRPSAPLARG
jgi:hypothetical protein